MRPEHTVTEGYMKSHMKSIKKKKLKSDGTKRGRRMDIQYPWPRVLAKEN
jgi:hypothetical protein